MKAVTNEFLSLLGNVKCQVVSETYDFDDEDDFISILATGKNFQGINVCVMMNNSDASIYFNIASIPLNKKDYIMDGINTINREYRWIKLFIDEEGELLLSHTDVAYEEFQGAEGCATMLSRIINIIDETKDDIQEIFLNNIDNLEEVSNQIFADEYIEEEDEEDDFFLEESGYVS